MGDHTPTQDHERAPVNDGHLLDNSNIAACGDRFRRQRDTIHQCNGANGLPSMMDADRGSSRERNRHAQPKMRKSQPGMELKNATRDRKVGIRPFNDHGPVEDDAGGHHQKLK